MLKLTLNNCVIFGRAQNFPRGFPRGRGSKG